MKVYIALYCHCQIVNVIGIYKSEYAASGKCRGIFNDRTQPDDVNSKVEEVDLGDHIKKIPMDLFVICDCREDNIFDEEGGLKIMHGCFLHFATADRVALSICPDYRKGRKVSLRIEKVRTDRNKSYDSIIVAGGNV